MCNTYVYVVLLQPASFNTVSNGMVFVQCITVYGWFTVSICGVMPVPLGVCEDLPCTCFGVLSVVATSGFSCILMTKVIIITCHVCTCVVNWILA